MLVVNRQDFIAWTEGILLERSSQGDLRVGDRKVHEKAKEAMDAGEIIALSENGRIVSYMGLGEGGYEESIASTSQLDYNQVEGF